MGELQPGTENVQEEEALFQKKPAVEEYTQIEIADRIIKYRRICQYRGLLCDADGIISAGSLKYDISEVLMQLGKDKGANVAANVNSIFNLIDIRAFPYPLSIRKNLIHCKNGTITVDLATGEIAFSRTMETCLYRLNCAYDPETPPPAHFIGWLKDVFSASEDRQTLIEFLGYALLPTTKAHKALSIVGNGGTGKSIIVKLTYKIWGDARIDGDLSDLGKNFELPRLEAAPVFVVDDAGDKPLDPSTEAVTKKVITADSPIRAEQKYKEVSSIIPTTKFIVCGEAPLPNLMNGSDGFARRWLILHTNELPKDRVIDPDLADKFDPELDGIFMLMLAGLSNLIKRNFQFTVSDYAKEYLSTVKTDGGAPEAFIAEMLVFGADYAVTAKELGEAYRNWCYNNGVEMSKGGKTAVSKYLSAHPEKYGVKPVTNMGQIKARGYSGVTMAMKPSTVDTASRKDGKDK